MPFSDPMPKSISDEVPFIKINGRRALTRKQLEEHPELATFVELFPASFEKSFTHDAVFFVEPKPPTVN